MDFLEGALLGPLWSDTDYEERPHRGLRLLLSFLFWVGLLAMVYLINFRALSLTNVFGFPWFPLFLVLVFVSPFLSMVYYQMPVIIRFPILALQAAKHLSFYLLVYKIFLPYLHLDLNEMISGLTSFSDNTIGRFIEFYTERYETAGMFIGTAFLAGLGILIFILSLLVVYYFPQIVLLLQRQIQMVWDFTVRAFVRLTDRRKKEPSPVPQPVMGSQGMPVSQAERRPQEGARHSLRGRKKNDKKQAEGLKREPAGEKVEQARQERARQERPAQERPQIQALPPREELFQRHEVRAPRINNIQEKQSEAKSQNESNETVK